MKTDNLEFHYVISFREGFGWEVCPDTETVKFPDGTIYDWDNNEWIASWTNSEDEHENLLDAIDIVHYNRLKSALNLLNEGAINA